MMLPLAAPPLKEKQQVLELQRARQSTLVLRQRRRDREVTAGHGRDPSQAAACALPAA
jgi:hypothetical protein